MPAMAKDPIRIGSLQSATGPAAYPAAYIGVAMANAVELLVDQVNQEGGVMGASWNWCFTTRRPIPSEPGP